MPSGWSGAVLCGGASRRMGTDKATLRVGGRAMAVRVADALRAAGADRVVAVGGDPSQLRSLGLDHVPDDRPGAGPLGGIVTALRLAADRPVLVASCDLVDPAPAAMIAVVRALERDPAAAAAVAVLDGRLQWVHAAWRPAALVVLEAELERGIRAIHRAAAGLRVVEVTGLQAGALRDADTPDDL